MCLAKCRIYFIALTHLLWCREKQLFFRTVHFDRRVTFIFIPCIIRLMCRWKMKWRWSELSDWLRFANRLFPTTTWRETAGTTATWRPCPTSPEQSRFSLMPCLVRDDREDLTSPDRFNMGSFIMWDYLTMTLCFPECTIPGGPIGGQTRVTLRNEHMQYIVTW